ncbi:head-tail joining protein [Vibrio fluvialis]|uniref:head-tail joining protein n=1 Tax=Vibrio TaxID=662 RepID=UPI0012AD882B|nr:MULTISPECIES: hypothetical protein [Vibrio]MBY8192516.1 hypothetical protein [Vibrio fluvialis]MCE7659385.1 hypothetical protein [Vibrio fluvialis]
MFDSEFERALALADNVVIDTFKNVLVSVAGNEPKPGIFDAPGNVNEISSGGQLASSETTVSMLESDAVTIKRDALLEITFEGDVIEHYIVINAYPDKTGMVKFTLAQRERGASKPPSLNIQY